MLWYHDFQASWENYILKNEKWIIFPESRYINLNPESFVIQSKKSWKACDLLLLFPEKKLELDFGCDPC